MTKGKANVDRIVDALALFIKLGKSKPNRKKVMGVALMTNAGSFATTISTIKKKTAHIDFNANSIWLTETGRDFVRDRKVRLPWKNDGIQQLIRSDLIKGLRPRQIFDVMLDGQWHSRAELAKATCLPDNTSFRTYISSLFKVTERKSNGSIRLFEFAFPFGRPSGFPSRCAQATHRNDDSFEKHKAKETITKTANVSSPSSSFKMRKTTEGDIVKAKKTIAKFSPLSSKSSFSEVVVAETSPSSSLTERGTGFPFDCLGLTREEIIEL